MIDEIIIPFTSPSNKPKNLLTGESPVFFITKLSKQLKILITTKITKKTIRKTINLYTNVAKDGATISPKVISPENEILLKTMFKIE